MPWFVKLEEGIVAKDRFDAVIPDHLAWLRGLEARGHRPSSGYWSDRKGCNGAGAGGMLLFWAESWDGALALVQSDPLIQQGCVRWTLHSWSLVFSASGLAPAPDPAGRGGMGQTARNEIARREMARSETAAPDPSSAGETPSPPGSDPAPPAAPL